MTDEKNHASGAAGDGVGASGGHLASQFLRWVGNASSKKELVFIGKPWKVTAVSLQNSKHQLPQHQFHSLHADQSLALIWLAHNLQFETFT